MVLVWHAGNVVAAPGGLGVFHPRFERTAPLGGQIQHVPERIEQVVLAVLLARLGRYVQKFATPKMPDHVALALEDVKHRHVPFLTGLEILLHTDGGGQGCAAEATWRRSRD